MSVIRGIGGHSPAGPPPAREPGRSWRTRRVYRLAVFLPLVALLALLTVGGSLGVGAASVIVTGSPSNFESGDGNMTLDASGDTDWNCFVGGGGFQPGSPPAGCAVTTGATQAAADPNGEIKLTSGSKFDDNCPAFGPASGGPGKDDFTNIAEYTEIAANGDAFFYGGAIRASASGSSSGDVEFDQKNTVTTGCRTAGDRLLAYDFTNGGTMLTLSALTWLTPATGGTCIAAGSTTTPPCWSVPKAIDPSEFNGLSNATAITAAHNGMNGQALAINQFLEFGTNLTKALNLSGCVTFARNLFTSRTSGSSFTSNPEDVETENHPINTCVTPTLVTALNPATQVYGQAVTDTATLSKFVGTNPPGGTVTFNVYNGSDGTACVVANLTETVAGSALAAGTPATPPTATSTATIDSGTTLSPGSYEVQAVYSGDGVRNLTSSSTCGSEPLTIKKVSPTLATTLHDTTAGTTANGGTTLNAAIGDVVFDTAILTGAVAGPAGKASITYAFYTDSVCSLNAVSETPSPNTFTSPAPIPQSNSFTFVNAGTYYWQAQYSGDANNNGATSPCNEVLVVKPNNPTLATTLHDSTNGTSAAGGSGQLNAAIGDSVFDTATLSGAAAGPTNAASISYAFFTDAACSQSAVSETPSPNTFTTLPGSASAIPPSNSFTFENAGAYYWQASYSGDKNNVTVASPCNEVLVVAKNQPSLTTTLNDTTASSSAPGGTTLNASIGDSVFDQANLSGAAAGPTNAANIAYAFYTDSSCSQNAVNETPSPNTFTTLPGSASAIPASNAFTFVNAGTYYWQARYSGDSNNKQATSPCNEVLVVAPNNPTLATTLHDSTNGTTAAGGSGQLNAAIGDSVFDTASLTGAANGAAGGATITYAFYTDAACSQHAVSETPTPNTFTSPGPIPQSNAFTFQNAGTFYWQAVYSGDNNNVGATSPCNEILVVAKNRPALTTTLTDTSTSSSAPGGTTLNASIGDSVFDQANLSGAAAGPTNAASISYAFYTDSSCSQNIVSETPAPNTFTTLAGSASAIPASNAFTFVNAGTYYWQAHYSGDANNKQATSPCNEVLVVAPNTPTLATTLNDSTNGTSAAGGSGQLNAAIGDSVFDTASLTGAANGAANGATITYAFYTDASCSQNAVSETPSPNTFTSPGPIPQSNAFTFQNAGTFYWQAVYSGDNNNVGATSPCNEILVVAPNKPGMTTAQNLIPNDTATISGATSTAGGMITFNLFSPTDATCGGQPALTQMVTVNGNGLYSTTNTTFHATLTGTWRWQVLYSGDNNNVPTSSSCGVEQFTIDNTHVGP